MSDSSSAPRRLTIRAPAKINLGLRVLGKRPDGYHEIETLFIAVTLFDELRFAAGDSGGVTLKIDGDGAERLDAGESNLVMRAIRQVEQDTGECFNLEIRLSKKIPIAAGLGGGSSDAAAALTALSLLFPEMVPVNRLEEWALRVGSDVPFFLGPPSAIGRGRGERLTTIPIDLSWWAVLACPRIASPTKEVYSALDLTSLPKIPDFDMRLEGEGFFASLSRLHNDLQEVVIRRVPEVLHWKKRLLTLGAEGAYVSGSGPTVFGIFRTEPDPNAVAALRSEGIDAFVVRPVVGTMTMVIGLS